MTRPLNNIVLASPTAERHSNLALMTATVLAGWFDVPLILATDTETRQADLESLARGIDTKAETPRCFSRSFCEEVMTFAHENGPSLVIGDATPLVLDIAARSTQPTFLVADITRRRVPTGPLVVDAVHGTDDLETIALAASWARSLEQPVRVVEELGAGSSADATVSRQRLTEMGITAGVDQVRAHGQSAAVLVGRTRDAMALIVPNRKVDDERTTGRALRSGLNVLVCAAPDPTQPATEYLDMTSISQVGTSSPRDVEILDARSCNEHLARNIVGRLAYVSDGWPTVVPINYVVDDDGAIVIKSVVGGKTTAADNSDVVCFEIDGVDRSTRQGWSVVVHGTLETISDPRGLDAAWRHDPEPWLEGQEWRWLRIVPLSTSGRRLRPAEVSATAG